MTNQRPTPMILLILDGWGIREDRMHNAIAQAKTPHWDSYWQDYPHTRLEGSGMAVGLPKHQMGNSEVGHLTIGAGRTIYQDLTRIDQAIADGSFASNTEILSALQLAKTHARAVHIMGLLSPGGVHSHEHHIHALLKLCAQENMPQVYLHAFLDGRDTPPQSALASLKAIDDFCRTHTHCHLASVIGRYYAMDRDKRYERIEPAYRLLVDGEAPFQAHSGEEALALAYQRGESDEFVSATAIHPEGATPIRMLDGDVLFFMNFRSDRAREISQAFLEPDFHGFTRPRVPALGRFVCLASYDARFKVPVAFMPQNLEDILSAVLSEHHLTQLRIAETEKYAHVTFFFNGGVETPYPGEDRLLIPSPPVATYDLQPEMSAPAITDKLVDAILAHKYDVIICNFANPDMVGHTGNMQATIRAIETIDTALGRIVKAAQQSGGEVMITADHGNAECMYDESTQQPHTAHTSDPVPFLYIGRNAKIIKENGTLADIAPTLLYLLQLPTPKLMTGKNLLQLL